MAKISVRCEAADAQRINGPHCPRRRAALIPSHGEHAADLTLMTESSGAAKTRLGEARSSGEIIKRMQVMRGNKKLFCHRVKRLRQLPVEQQLYASETDFNSAVSFSIEWAEL